MNHDKFQKNLKKKIINKNSNKNFQNGKIQKNCQFKKGEYVIRGNVIFVLNFLKKIQSKKLENIWFQFSSFFDIS